MLEQCFDLQQKEMFERIRTFYHKHTDERSRHRFVSVIAWTYVGRTLEDKTPSIGRLFDYLTSIAFVRAIFEFEESPFHNREIEHSLFTMFENQQSRFQHEGYFHIAWDDPLGFRNPRWVIVDGNPVRLDEVAKVPRYQACARRFWQAFVALHEMGSRERFVLTCATRDNTGTSLLIGPAEHMVNFVYPVGVNSDAPLSFVDIVEVDTAYGPDEEGAQEVSLESLEGLSRIFDGDYDEVLSRFGSSVAWTYGLQVANIGDLPVVFDARDAGPTLSFPDNDLYPHKSAIVGTSLSSFRREELAQLGPEIRDNLPFVEIPLRPNENLVELPPLQIPHLYFVSLIATQPFKLRDRANSLPTRPSLPITFRVAQEEDVSARINVVFPDRLEYWFDLLPFAGPDAFDVEDRRGFDAAPDFPPDYLWFDPP